MGFRHILVVSGLAVAACSPGEPIRQRDTASFGDPSDTVQPSTPVEAAATESPLADDLRILGTEPFWAIDISKATSSATFSRMDEADVSLSYPTETQGPDGAVVLTATSPQGDVVMTLQKKDCSDGMSDRSYPWEAEVGFNGETLKGCAATPEFIRQTPQ